MKKQILYAGNKASNAKRADKIFNFSIFICQKFIYIKIRYLSPTILFVAIMSLINSFKVFREVYLLTGDYPYDTLYMLQHFMNNTFKALDYQKLSVAAIIMCSVMVVIIGLLFVVENHFGKDVEG